MRRAAIGRGTGFLGAGKTTFLRRYVRYLVAQGHNVCILENDFGYHFRHFAEIQPDLS